MSRHCDDDEDPGAGGFASPPCFLHELAPGYTGMQVVDAQTRVDVMRWRRAERRRLIEARRALPAARRAAAAAAIAATLTRYLGCVVGRVVSAYWPLRGEPDLREWLGRTAAAGACTALPVVTERGRPLAFHTWQPGEAVEPGFWNIPVPAAGRAVTPDIIIAPVVGFDPQGFRLGYGGGYFDRTLAALGSAPLVLGVGYEMAALTSIFPLPHDIPMKAVVTETAVHGQAAAAAVDAPRADRQPLAAVARDDEGFLLDPQAWNGALAEALAQTCEVELTAAHWDVVQFIRDYFEQHQRVPEARHALRVVKAAAARSGMSSRRYLQSLFPYGYGQQACKIAGMRKPLKLMLDL